LNKNIGILYEDLSTVMLIPFNLHDKCKISGKAREAEETVVDLDIIGYHKNRGKGRKKI